MDNLIFVAVMLIAQALRGWKAVNQRYFLWLQSFFWFQAKCSVNKLIVYFLKCFIKTLNHSSVSPSHPTLNPISDILRFQKLTIVILIKNFQDKC